jgi:hypothetical protein
MKTGNERGFLSPFESGRKEISPFSFPFSPYLRDCRRRRWEKPLIRLRTKTMYSKANLKSEKLAHKFESEETSKF